jgi:hypothetical protein
MLPSHSNGGAIASVPHVPALDALPVVYMAGEQASIAGLSCPAYHQSGLMVSPVINLG